MKSETRSATGWLLLGVFGVLLVGIFVFPNVAEGQQGNNAVFNTSSTCSPCTASPAFIDASVFGGTHTDLCTVLHGILSGASTTLPPGGAVIDARGLPGATGTSMVCTASPWAGITNPPPTTILLPATAATAPIVIQATWALPPNTRLIGEGGSIGSGTVGTTIQAASSLTSGAMIQMGTSIPICLPPGNSICNGISVENLVLDGQGNAINGIENLAAQDRSYVDNVSLYQIRGTGLQIDSDATGSGPYSNITFDTGNHFGGLTSTVCAQIISAGGTRGIHGLSCISENNDPSAAVLLDSSNNSIEDVRIAGFYDGIRVGANANAQSNVLLNITGDTNHLTGVTPIIVVHIKTGFPVSDLSIMGANNAGGSTGTITIQDDVTGAQLTDTSVGIYALGEQPSSGIGHSRFTTSPSLPTWGVGSTHPTGTGCTRGSIYSCTGGGSGCQNKALWDCTPSGTSTMWSAVE